MNTQKIRKAAGYSGLGLILATAIVATAGKSIVAWPGNVDNHIDALNMTTSSTVKDVEVLEKFDIEQKKINEKVDTKLDDVVKAQGAMNTEQAVQGRDIKYIVRMLEKKEIE